MHRYTATALLLSMLPTCVQAADLHKARAAPVEFTYESSRDIFDVERCLIEVDTPTLPVVYRQPDRPGQTLIAYSAGFGVPVLIELTAIKGGTKIEIHVSKIGFRRAPVAGGLHGCI